MSDVAAALRSVRGRLKDAAERVGREAGDVTLVVVTKDRTVEEVRAAIAAGADDLGENRVQRLLAKQREIDGVRWHFIGTLQRNKVRSVIGSVDLIHSVDSMVLAQAIDRAAQERAIVQPVLLQVNTSGESSKHGVPIAEAATSAEAIARLAHVTLKGFMTIAPAGDLEASRACFAALRSLRDQTAQDLPGAIELSMGMTGDLELAVEEGATFVRVGTAIFGPRPR